MFNFEYFIHILLLNFFTPVFELKEWKELHDWSFRLINRIYKWFQMHTSVNRFLHYFLLPIFLASSLVWDCFIQCETAVLDFSVFHCVLLRSRKIKNTNIVFCKLMINDKMSWSIKSLFWLIDNNLSWF